MDQTSGSQTPGRGTGAKPDGPAAGCDAGTPDASAGDAGGATRDIARSPADAARGRIPKAKLERPVCPAHSAVNGFLLPVLVLRGAVVSCNEDCSWCIDQWRCAQPCAR